MMDTSPEEPILGKKWDVASLTFAMSFLRYSAS